MESLPSRSRLLRLVQYTTPGESTASLESAVPHAPAGWPDWSTKDEELLAPFLECSTPAQFLRLQQGVDMARLLEQLEDWSAVRLGALGPLDARASQVLTRKRTSFILHATEAYGEELAQVFTLFILHAAFDDEVRHLLHLLAQDKQMALTLGRMGAVRHELEGRGLKLESFPDRQERAGDVLRGLGRAARDALATSEVSGGARMWNMTAQLRHLPPAYQAAIHEVGAEQMRRHYSPGHMAVGTFDALTFGVPMGFYHLVAGTGEGLTTLAQGHYEQAARQLAPAALLVAVYTGGKAASMAGPGLRAAGESALKGVPHLRAQALQEVAHRLREHLGAGGLAELARHIRASRDAGVLVAAEGELGAVALYEARGNVPRAQAWLSQAKEKGTGPGASKASEGQGLAGLASLVDEATGHTPEVVQAKLTLAELETLGPRLPAETALLKKLNATHDTPPPGVPEGYTLWSEYVSYRRTRLAELEQGRTAQGPLRWEGYERMRGAFARGLAFERSMVSALRADAALPQTQRRWLRDFLQPRIEVHVGVSKPGAAGIRYADVLIIEEFPPSSLPPRVETFSFKSRNLATLELDPLTAQLKADARTALNYYGETLDILRPSLRQRVQVQRVRLVYEGGALKPKVPNQLRTAVEQARKEIALVEVLFQ
jgi:hypothetical protein